MTKYYRYILVFLIILSFALHLKVCDELLANDPNVLSPLAMTDMATYKELALKIAQGKYWQPFYWQPFYFTVFLAGIFKIFGTNIYNILFFQSLLGSLTILFAALSSELIWNRKTAIITTLLLLFSQVLCFYIPFMLISTLQSFWISLLLYITLLAFRKKKNIYWSYIGFILGCAILTRGNMWLFVPVLFILAIYYTTIQQNYKKKFIGKLLLPAILFLVFVILPQMPFIYINSKILGTLSGPSQASKVSFTYGNTAESPPAANEPKFGAGVIALNPTQLFWLDTADKISPAKRIIHFIKEKPLSYIELTFRKLLLFWDYREIPNNVNINTERLLSSTLTYFCFITTSILMVLAIPGILIYFPSLSDDKRKFLIPFLFTLCYWISISLVINLSRYRAPITPLLAVYAAGFINFIFFEKNNRTPKLVSILLILFSAFIVFFSYDFYRFNIESKVIRQISPEGISVKMKDKTMYLDNGPMIFGSWNLSQLYPNDIIIKKFTAVSNLASSTCTFSIPFLAKSPIKATLVINRKLFHIKSNKLGTITKEFNIPIDNASSSNMNKNKIVTVQINIKQLTGKLFYIVDKQRNHDRTIINNKPVNAELVCRLFL